MIVSIAIVFGLQKQIADLGQDFEIARREYSRLSRTDRVSQKFSAEFERIAKSTKSPNLSSRAWTYALVSAPKDFVRELDIIDHFHELPISDSLVELLPSFMKQADSFEEHRRIVELPDLVFDRSKTRSGKATALMVKANFLVNEDVLKWDIYSYIASKFADTNAARQANQLLDKNCKQQHGPALAKANAYVDFRMKDLIEDLRKRPIGLERHFLEAEDLYTHWLERDTFSAKPDPNFRIDKSLSEQFETMAKQAGTKPYAVWAWAAALCSAPRDFARETFLINRILATPTISPKIYPRTDYYRRAFLGMPETFAVGNDVTKVADFLSSKAPLKK